MAITVGNGWVAGGCWMIIDSSPVDHSRKFPTFSTSKMISYYKYLQYAGPP